MRSREPAMRAIIPTMTHVHEPDAIRAAIRDFLARRPEIVPKRWAREAGVSVGALPNFLSGLTRVMRYDTLAKLAHAANVPVGVLTGEVTDPLAKTQYKVDNAPLGLVSGDADDVMNAQLIVQLLRQLLEEQKETNRQLAALAADNRETAAPKVTANGGRSGR